jgi:protocadherin alpha
MLTWSISIIKLIFSSYSSGGLDALMQILVCRDEIGWNDKTRKMVVFATDGPMHFAGDGLLAGLVKKNDKACHLNDQGDYMASLEFDYPSLEEIYRELVKTKISVIFAVTSEVIYHYDQIYDLMKEVTSVDQLAADSSNILQLVEKGYNDAVKRAQFQDNAPSYIKVEYKTTCGGKYETPQDTSKCDNIEIGNEYLFDLDVTLLDYPDDGTKSLKIKIEEANIDSEALEIDIEIDYPCTSCTSLPGEPAAALCSRHGELKCGSCACDEGYAGKQ